MERRMDRDPDFQAQYISKIDEYVEKGYARILPSEEARVEGDKTFYLSHFMRRNPKKPTKLRFVFDAREKVNGSSLNDHLLQGPDKLTSLPAILFKFRQRAVALTADIRDMFHRVRVRPEDATALRFLWRGKDRDREPDVLQMNVLIFGASCSPLCAQEVKNRNALEYKEQYPEAYEAIVNRHYVDDYLDSVDTPQDAITRFQEVLEVQANGGFHLCNWMSNSVEVLEKIPEDIQSKSMMSMALGEDMECERVLGLFWRPDTDNFTFSLAFLKAAKEILSGFRVPTKRELLSLTMSIYDPLGFVAVLNIKARMIQQVTWRSKVDWDDEIPDSVHGAWSSWLSELKTISTFELPRCYSLLFSTADCIQLHIFGDAGEEAYRAVAYFRIEKGGTVETAFVMAKAKVTPLKSLSIPRLELQAALLGSRLAKFIEEGHEVKIDDTIFWTDSSNVLSWVRSDSKRHQQFVSVRIGEIQETTNACQWRWIPTSENVADELTKMSIASNWKPDSRWVNGSGFLLESEESWPKEKVRSIEEIDSLELKSNQILVIRQQASNMQAAGFSSWTRLIRVTAWMIRFTMKYFDRSKEDRKYLTMEEINQAEKWWQRKVQKESIAEEYIALSSKPQLPKASKLYKLSAVLDDDGIIRIHGRLDNARNLPTGVKRPVILDPKHEYTMLLVSYYHKVCGHHGQERIVNDIRQKFYIFHIRAAVKRAQQECQHCKNVRAQPAVPEMGQLPNFRLENVHPFNKTGLDYFGPLEVTVKRTKEKRYVALFTCLSIRAVHLELVNSLSTDSCIMAIRRFISRRGCPSEIHSDNGTNFHGAANEMKEALKGLDQDSIESFCTTQGITWRFIPPAAPHMGGSWERMVKGVKVAMGDTLTRKNLTVEVLQTLLIEAEHTVNSNPLTHVPDDPDDPEALTPNHFLIGRSSNLQPAGKFSDSDLIGRKQWRVVQQLANCFWKRYVREFLPTLLRRTKWNQTTKSIAIGDIVLEVNPNLVRNSWPKGIVVDCFPGRDNITRVVDVKFANGKVYRRPVSRLCILDVNRPGGTNPDNLEERLSED